MAEFKLGTLLLLRALLVCILLVSARGESGNEEVGEATETNTTSTTVAPTAASRESETTEASVDSTASGANETLTQIDDKMGEAAEDEGNEEEQQAVAANETVAIGASRGSGGELSGTPPKWFCPIFQNTVVKNSKHGKLVGYAIRLSDYDFLAHSDSIMRATFDQPINKQALFGSAYEAIMFNAPAEIDVSKGTQEPWLWNFISAYTFYNNPLKLYRMQVKEHMNSADEYAPMTGINQDPPKLQTDKNAPTKNCYAMHYSFKPGAASEWFKPQRQFVHHKVFSIMSTPPRHYTVELDGGSICPAKYEAGMPIMCDGFLSYVGLGSTDEYSCHNTIEAVKIADYYETLKYKIDREDLCKKESRCKHGWGLPVTPSSHKIGRAKGAPISRAVGQKRVGAPKANAGNQPRRNWRRS